MYLPEQNVPSRNLDVFNEFQVFCTSQFFGRIYAAKMTLVFTLRSIKPNAELGQPAILLPGSAKRKWRRKSRRESNIPSDEQRAHTRTSFPVTGHKPPGPHRNVSVMQLATGEDRGLSWAQSLYMYMYILWVKHCMRPRQSPGLIHCSIYLKEQIFKTIYL